MTFSKVGSAFIASALLIGAAPQSDLAALLLCKSGDTELQALMYPPFKARFVIRDADDHEDRGTFTAIPKRPTDLLGAKVERVEVSWGENDADSTFIILRGSIDEVIKRASTVYHRRPKRNVSFHNQSETSFIWDVVRDTGGTIIDAKSANFRKLGSNTIRLRCGQ